MSNRRGRGRPTSAYASRLRRTAGPRGSGTAWWRWPGWRWLPAVLAVAAEAGHLFAGYLEWPGSTVRGAGHVVLGGLLGLIAAVALYGGGRPRLAAGVVALAGPLWWLGGTLADAMPYQAVPVAAAAGVTLVELTLAAALLGAARTATAAAQPARTRASGRHA